VRASERRIEALSEAIIEQMEAMHAEDGLPKHLSDPSLDAKHRSEGLRKHSKFMRVHRRKVFIEFVKKLRWIGLGPAQTVGGLIKEQKDVGFLMRGVKAAHGQPASQPSSRTRRAAMATRQTRTTSASSVAFCA
jgi:hypothetical protein